MTVVTLNVNGLAVGGECIAQVTAGEQQLIGKKALLRNVVPGEEVIAEIVKDSPRLLHAKLIEITRSSPHRVTPPCPYFEHCGGCDYQHMAVPFQRSEKLRMVEQMLRFQSKLHSAEGVRLVGEALPALNYRSRVSFQLDEDGAMGFFGRGTREVVSIDQCLLANSMINQTLERIRNTVPDLGVYASSLTIETKSAQKTFCVLVHLREDTPRSEIADMVWFQTLATCVPNLSILFRKKLIYCQERGEQCNLPSRPTGHFSQVNPDGNDHLIQLVSQYVTSEEVTDLYAGAGNFSIPLARSGKKVEAVDFDRALTQYGNYRAKQLGLSKQLSFTRENCADYVRNKSLRSTVVLDPPRSGAKQVVNSFKPHEVKQVVYVSCNLPTLARDLKTLVGNGYKLISIDLIDMFTHTHHVETVSVLESGIP
jgi:23S rRNA (uracil1939-C5)-methyltransferase